MTFLFYNKGQIRKGVSEKAQCFELGHCAGTKSVNTEPFYLSLNVPQWYINLKSALTGRRHVWTTPDMTGCLAISIKANEN